MMQLNLLDDSSKVTQIIAISIIPEAIRRRERDKDWKLFASGMIGVGRGRGGGGVGRPGQYGACPRPPQGMRIEKEEAGSLRSSPPAPARSCLPSFPLSFAENLTAGQEFGGHSVDTRVRRV